MRGTARLFSPPTYLAGCRACTSALLCPKFIYNSPKRFSRSSPMFVTPTLNYASTSGLLCPSSGQTDSHSFGPGYMHINSTTGPPVIKSHVLQTQGISTTNLQRPAYPSYYAPFFAQSGYSYPLEAPPGQSEHYFLPSILSTLSPTAWCSEAGQPLCFRQPNSLPIVYGFAGPQTVYSGQANLPYPCCPVGDRRRFSDFHMRSLISKPRPLKRLKRFFVSCFSCLNCPPLCIRINHTSAPEPLDGQSKLRSDLRIIACPNSRMLPPIPFPLNPVHFSSRHVAAPSRAAGQKYAFVGSRLDLSRLTGDLTPPLGIYSNQSLESLEFHLLEKRCMSNNEVYRIGNDQLMPYEITSGGDLKG
ncbi:unnamed protein product [Protopolystoma xenopodis]|uniref:Uncharacterized protein n=1 Tax=Protopolystoma xenopodis TaxID=117903 RepID=A0A3S5CB06_9PLAT|nr:unnamed protein product [Protopolystoma xenopodis]